MSDFVKKPNWDLLYETASAQEGYFTTGQAAEVGFSSQLLLKHIRAGRVTRTRNLELAVKSENILSDKTS